MPTISRVWAEQGNAARPQKAEVHETIAVSRRLAGYDRPLLINEDEQVVKELEAMTAIRGGPVPAMPKYSDQEAFWKFRSWCSGSVKKPSPEGGSLPDRVRGK